MKKNFLPISIDISESKILVIGGGESALKKIKILQKSNAHVHVLSEDFIDDIQRLDILKIRKEYEKNDLKGYLMLYSCTDDDLLDQQIAADGLELGVLVNVHDKPSFCQFVSPAIYRYGNISVAVSSNGENVQEAIRVRNLIQEFLENLKNTQI
ncbi:MAG TPA: bifunctional precorrin-2 dehydrogenase/sirohydrochlorin ferrochelatase [Prolixibacteraceae bacterium]|nr:bifunctional precorrin-2 dehydrogenase/sirohydrochlorin ferrochelatase [Prolixibacteraceae bacterium]